MRDKAAAVLDVPWIAAAIVAALLPRGVLRVLDRRDHKEAPERPLWRYRTEPKIPQADRWSVTYWGTVGRDHT